MCVCVLARVLARVRVCLLRSLHACNVYVCMQTSKKNKEEGWWLQSYGFSKALVNAYTRILASQSPSLCVTACTPGFVATDMTTNYSQFDSLKTPEDGADTPAFLILGEQDKMTSKFFAHS